MSGLSVSSWRPDSALPTVHLFQVPSSDPDVFSLSCRRADKPGHCLAVVDTRQETTIFDFKVNKSNSLSPPRFDTTNSYRVEAFRVILPTKCLLPRQSSELVRPKHAQKPHPWPYEST